MAARLQAATGSGKPVLLRVDYQGGHGAFGATQSHMEELLFCYGSWVWRVFSREQTGDDELDARLAIIGAA